MMQGNDIGNFNDIGQGVLFEGLLASPPERRFFQRADSEWDKELSKWKANDLPLKALVDSSGANFVIYALGITAIFL
jgi:hypothetical protein